MENKNKHITILNNVLDIFRSSGFGLEEVDSKTYNIIDISGMSKINCGGIKILKSGEVSVKLGKSNRHKTNMETRKIKFNMFSHLSSVRKQTKELIRSYNKVKNNNKNEGTMKSKKRKRYLLENERSEIMSLLRDYKSQCYNDDCPYGFYDAINFLTDHLDLSQDVIEYKYGDTISKFIGDTDMRNTRRKPGISESRSRFERTKRRPIRENRSRRNVGLKKELKDSFRAFIRKNKTLSESSSYDFDDITELLMDDDMIIKLRQSSSYLRASEDEKVEKLMRIFERKHKGEFSKSELFDACTIIAETDDEIDDDLDFDSIYNDHRSSSRFDDRYSSRSRSWVNYDDYEF